MPTLQILAASILAIVGYAMVQDQVSVRVSPEYFTVGHDSSHLPFADPTLLGLYWGFFGGIAGGIFLGIGLGLSARVGDGPKLTLKDVAPGLGLLVLTIALASLGAGCGTYFAGNLADLRMRGPWGNGVPPEGHIAFLAVAAAHWTTYLVSVSGSILLCVGVSIHRLMKRADPVSP